MTTQRIPFTEWLPDQPSTANALQDVNNVVPVTIGYSPFNSPVNFSNAASENLISAFAGKFSNLTQLYAGGQTKLFKFNAATPVVQLPAKGSNTKSPSSVQDSMHL